MVKYQSAAGLCCSQYETISQRFVLPWSNPQLGLHSQHRCVRCQESIQLELLGRFMGGILIELRDSELLKNKVHRWQHG